MTFDDTHANVIPSDTYTTPTPAAPGTLARMYAEPPHLYAVPKTIRMPKPYLEAWLEALRSGRYPQTRKKLQDQNGFCCLGVLQMVVSGRTERHALPSMEWLNEHGIHFSNPDAARSPLLFDRSGNCDGADGWNDSGRANFRQIADMIEGVAVPTHNDAVPPPARTRHHLEQKNLHHRVQEVSRIPSYVLQFNPTGIKY